MDMLRIRNLFALLVTVAAIAGCTSVASPAAEATSPRPRTFTSEDLGRIVVSPESAPDGMTVESGASGHDALTLPLPPGGPPIDEAAFVDALTTRIDHAMTGGYTSWSALFESGDDAKRAFAFIATQHESDDGWRLPRSSADVKLGDESVSYSGPYPPWDAARIYFWRENNLLLAAVGVGDFRPDVLRTIAQGMDSRAE